DIITSVSGIVIVIVLLLTLELVERPDVIGDGGTHAAAALLRNSLAEADHERDALHSATASGDSGVRELAEAASSDFVAEIEGLEQRRRELEARVETAREQALALEAARRTAEVEEFDLKPRVDELEQLTRRAEALTNRLERSDDRPVYSLPRGTNRRGWLVDIGGGEVSAAPLGTPQPPVAYRKQGLFGKSAEAAFLDWAKSQDASEAYFLLLVRPAGATAYGRIERGLQAGGYAFGFDLVGADQTVLDPQRGAAP
ncbi:MAG: hypothetical protein WD069_22940, partial [Planctomycetales bacterium]